jgi:hypothetical protein
VHLEPWNTCIWVDSADETAARVRDAGGTVLTEPFDVMGGWRCSPIPRARRSASGRPRTTKARGSSTSTCATFIASRFVPENRDLANRADATTSAA